MFVYILSIFSKLQRKYSKCVTLVKKIVSKSFFMLIFKLGRQHSLTLFELLDPFLFGCLHFHNLYFFLFLLSLSLTMCTLPPPTQPADVRCYFKTYFSPRKKLVLTLGAPTAIPSNLTSLKEAGVCVLYRPAN